MANGDYFGLDRLQQLIKPIEAIRPDIEAYAKSAGLETTFHSKGWPGVNFLWENEQGLQCTIQLVMDDDTVTYGIGYGSHKDIEGERYIFMSHLADLKTPLDPTATIEKVKEAKAICDLKRFEDLSLSKYDAKQRANKSRQENIKQTIDEIIELLKNCNLHGWANKYATWKQEIVENENNPIKLESIFRKLYVASAPRGWLGDYPIASSIKDKYNYEAMETRRRDLVERMIAQLEAAGLKI